MKTLTSTQRDSSDFVNMHDDFVLYGPNGRHRCLVLELLCDSVSDAAEACLLDGRSPGALAKSLHFEAILGTVQSTSCSDAENAQLFPLLARMVNRLYSVDGA